MKRKTDVLIVGGSAAGVTTAITVRRHYPDAEITLARKENQVLIPCGIPYIFGTVGSPENNLIPDAVLSKNNIDLITDEVTSIDRKGKAVTTASGDAISYKKMVLATGSVPFVPPIPDTRLNNVFTVKKEVDYLKHMSQALDKAKDLVIIGGGFIGVEFADECRKRQNLNVSVIELLPHCLLLACDEDICSKAEDKLKENGVNILADTRAEAIVGNGKVEHVQLAGGEKLRADAVIMGIGVVPNSDLAQSADLKVDERHSIYVDEFMRTSDENIFAAGDCARKTSFFTGGPSRLMLASIASIESRVAGANLFTLRRRNERSIGVFSTVIDDLCIGSAGMTERMARETGFDVVTGEASSPNRHPVGMPGVTDVSVKLIFSKESGIMIGGQICGGPSVGEAINIIGATIQKRMRADDIATLQVGTHPALTASPIAYQITNAAEIALTKMR